jgi:hypothetical protein
MRNRGLQSLRDWEDDWRKRRTRRTDRPTDLERDLPGREQGG